MGYTLAQVREFMAAIDRQKRTALKHQALIARAAGASNSGFKKFLREIDGAK